MAPGLEADDAEAAFQVVESDPLDEPGQNLGFGVCVLTHATSARWFLCVAARFQDLDKTGTGAQVN